MKKIEKPTVALKATTHNIRRKERNHDNDNCETRTTNCKTPWENGGFLRLSGVRGVPYGIRTRVAAVRGRRPRPLDEWDEALCV